MFNRFTFNSKPAKKSRLCFESMESDWESLPEELLDLVFKRLVLYLDSLRFAAVCKSWYWASKNKQINSVPMLLIPDRQKNIWNFCDVTNDKVLKMQLKWMKKRFCGSSKGWLIAAISADPISNANDCIVVRILNVNAVAPLFFETDLYIKAYLVGSNEEELLLVHRYSTFTCQCRVTNGFRLFKMDDDKYTWIEKNDLGDFALFVGDNSSISVVASKIQGCESNCIYFYDDNDLTKRDRSFTDFGVYNIKSQRILKPAHLPHYGATGNNAQPPPRSCPKLRFKPGYIYRLSGPYYYPRQYAFSTATGLYGFDHLKTPKGFRRFVDDAIERSGELVAYISGMPSSAEIIRAMDEISNRVCSVIDSAELCRQTHPDSFRCFAEQEGNLLTDEAHRVAHYLLRLDFERSGIHLSAEKVDRVNRLSIDISQLCRQFNQNIVNDPGTVHCKGNSSFDNRKSLTEHFDTIHDKTHKLCGEKLLCKEPVYPKHEIHICIPYGVSRINKNELKKKKNQEE
ncbi:hypothetical protein Prudu_007598 [Prunus dulcis]|uniref:KIB1-4 beta-propeller domain-containing protein n=1 Tax=Prunus dulcis TaxID=3755 RepID=A0A4Y1R2F4_PRUDU|nr:hypothetical protein Prudu_007598 [Prunus dulcis]